MNIQINRRKIDLQTFFDQYLRDTRIPTFEYSLVDGVLFYRWTNCVKGFKMKTKVYINNEMHWLDPSQRWQRIKAEEAIKKVEVDKDFYVASFELTEIVK